MFKRKAIKQQLLHLCSEFEHKMCRNRYEKVCILLCTLLGALVILKLSLASFYHTRTPTIVSQDDFVDAKKQYNSVFSYSDSEVVEVHIIGFTGKGTTTLIQTNNLQNVLVLGYKCGSKLILTNETYYESVYVNTELTTCVLIKTNIIIKK